MNREKNMGKKFDTIDLFFIIMISTYFVALFLFITIFLIRYFELVKKDKRENKPEHESIKTAPMEDIYKRKRAYYGFDNVDNSCLDMENVANEIDIEDEMYSDKECLDVVNVALKIDAEDTITPEPKKVIGKECLDMDNVASEIEDAIIEKTETKKAKKKPVSKKKKTTNKRKTTKKSSGKKKTTGKAGAKRNYKNNISYVKNNPRKK
jgi:hypothetical protein